MVLSDLAASIGASKNEAGDSTVQAAIDAVTSSVATRVKDNDEERVFMVRSRVSCVDTF